MNRPARSALPEYAWPLAALLAWLLPGLGHWAVGERRRGVIVGLTLLALFTAGLIIGGIDVVDRRRDTLWFVGQALIGPVALAVDQYHTHLDAQAGSDISDSPEPPAAGRPDPPYHRSLGRVNELGTLYCTLAGVLNLLAILDVVGRQTSPAPAEDPRADRAGPSRDHAV